MGWVRSSGLFGGVGVAGQRGTGLDRWPAGLALIEGETRRRRARARGEVAGVAEDVMMPAVERITAGRRGQSWALVEFEFLYC